MFPRARKVRNSQITHGTARPPGRRRSAASSGNMLSRGRAGSILPRPMGPARLGRHARLDASAGCRAPKSRESASRASRERPRRQQNRARDAAEEEQRRDVFAVAPHPEVQAQPGAVPGLEGADHLASAHGRSGRQRGVDRFETREQSAGVPDREHRTIDDHTREVHDAGGRSEHPGVVGRDVDAAVARRIPRLRGDERAQDRVRGRDRPRPRAGGRGRAAGQNREGDEKKGKAASHPPIFRDTDAAWPTRGRPAGNRGERRRVGE